MSIVSIPNYDGKGTKTYEVDDAVVSYVRRLRSEREEALSNTPHTVAGLIAALHARIELETSKRDVAERRAVELEARLRELGVTC